MEQYSSRLSALSPEQRALFELRLKKKVPGALKKHIIPRGRVSNIFPLSFAQQRLWFLDQLEPGSPFYNIPAVVRLTGTLNSAALEQSINEIVRRHEALRTTFPLIDGRAVQFIYPHLTLTLSHIDLQGLPEQERELVAVRLTAEEARRPFDLARGPLLRISLLIVGREEYWLLLTMHHIISDAWSVGILAKEFATFYHAYSGGETISLPELTVQYADFACWQREWLQGDVLETQLAYWKRQLSGFSGMMALPADFVRPPVQRFQGKLSVFAIPQEVHQGLKELSRQEGVTLFMLLLAAFQTLLYRFTGQEDIALGTDAANRNQLETEKLIGFFVNLLVLRTDMSGNPTFLDLLARVRRVALEAYNHQDLPFEMLLDIIPLSRSLSHMPLVQVLFNLQNAMMPVLNLSSLQMQFLETDSGSSRFDLVLTIEEVTNQELRGIWRYNTDLFEAGTIINLSDCFITLLCSILAQPDTRIEKLEMRSETERRKQIMDQHQRKEASIKKFKNIKPRAVNIAQQEDLVKIDTLLPTGKLPLVISPAIEDVDLAGWAKNNRDLIETKLLAHGAILFRGFNISSNSKFEEAAAAICLNLYGDYGDLPREQEDAESKVYSSTPYPADQAILFHNESSHISRWPIKQWFFCIKAAQQGGETPLVDCREIYRQLAPSVLELFERKQLLYVRNFTEGLDVSWQSFFKTNDKAVVEAYCKENAMDCVWKKNNGLRIQKMRPAITTHPKTGEKIFFNQIQLHHPSCLDTKTRESLSLVFQPEDFPRCVYYGDGSPIEDAVMAQIQELYWKTAAIFPWQEGDIVMVDNMLVAHARMPFSGERKVAVAMGEMFEETEENRNRK